MHRLEPCTEHRLWFRCVSCKFSFPLSAGHKAPLTSGRDGITPCLFFMKTTIKSSGMKKKPPNQHGLFRHYYCYYHLHHDQGIFIHATSKVWLLPRVPPNPAGAHHGFPSGKGGNNNQPKIWEKERELREANFHTVTEKEIFQKISFSLQRLLVVVERAFQWKRAKQP